MNTESYYAQKIADDAVHVDDDALAQLIADAAEDEGVDLPWEEQGDIHEAIEMEIVEGARQVARVELEAALRAPAKE